MNSYDMEVHVSRQKEMARRAGETYSTISHLRNGGAGPARNRVLAGLGARLVAVGYRLQGEVGRIPAAPEMADTLGLSGTAPCVEC